MGRHRIPDPQEPEAAGKQPDHESTGLGDDAVPPRRRRRLDEWRGGHRSEGGRRGVSVGVIAALVTVVVMVTAVIAWQFFGSVLSHRSDTASARCVAGEETVAVVADPSIADALQGLAEQYTGSARPVGDRCMSVSVKPASANAVVNGFIGDWPAELGQRPALWIPGSSISTARLRAAVGTETVSDSRPLVTSPVLLAVRPELKSALGEQDWAVLPRLQTTPDALDQLKLPNWGSLRLALPITGNSDAALLAVEAVAEASAPAGEPAIAGVGATRTLVGGQPRLADDSLAEAMNVLLGSDTPAAAPVHAVVTTEQQLFARGESATDLTGTLTSWLPSGPVPVADYPTVLLAGTWLSDEQVSAASEFARFLRKPDQLARLAQAGFRAEGVDMPASDVTDFPDLPDALAVADDSMRVTLAIVLSAPSNGSVTTIMLDESMTAQDGGKTRLANVVAALDNALSALPSDSTVALWTFDGAEGRNVVSAGPLSEQLDALTTGLDSLTATSSGAVSFTTLRLVYDEALAHYRDGRSNSVLLITTGPHTDRTLDGAGLQDFIRGAVDPARPVAVNVIDFGDGSDRATWQAVAQLSGGSYQQLATANSPELATTLTTLLR